MLNKKRINHNKEINQSKAPQPSVKKNKIGLFYKINFFIALFISLILLYFIILVSAKPKSFPYITKKVEKYLQENFGKDIAMESSYIGFTRYGSFKILVNNLKISKSSDDGTSQEFEIPSIEAELPLYNVLLLKFVPSKIKVVDPTIIFHPSINDQLDVAESDLQGHLIYSAPLISFLSAIKNDKLSIKIFEMQNLKFIIRKENKPDSEIFLKASLIKVESKNRFSNRPLQISSINTISFNHGADIYLNANCKFSAHVDDTFCNLALSNLATASIANLSPALAALYQVNTTINVTATLAIKNQEINNLSFKAQAKSGYFNLPKFFSKKINFSNLMLNGQYNNELDVLNLSSIEADLDVDKNNKDVVKEKHLSMSLYVTNLQNTKNQKSNFDIKLSNVPANQISDFWPISIAGQDIRKWVAEHISEGKIENAFAKFSLSTIDGVTDLDNIDSQISFTNLSLSYDEFFPKLTALNGVAEFTKNKMNIAIASGNVLKSKIYDTNVSIDDFNSAISMLNIIGNISGNAADGLKHANYKSAFATEIEKYFNGNSVGNFAIKVPLQETVDLKDIYILANQKMENLNNDYIKGAININSVKNFNSNSFVTSIDLSAATLESKVFDVHKKPLISAELNFSLIVLDDYTIQLKNINLWKKENIIENKKSIIAEAKLSGDITLKIDPFIVTEINLKNQNFGNNNYSISYQNDEKQKLQKVSVSGKILNLASFLQNQLPFSSSSNNTGKLFVKVAIDKVLLVNKKYLNKLYLSLNSVDGIFYNSVIKTSYNKQQSFNLHTVERKPKENFTTIIGAINDVGYLAEGLNISDTIFGGNAKIKMINQIKDGVPTFAGEVKIDNDITFYENNTTKRLAKNNLFSTIKDTIFSNNKTIFNTVKLDFTFSKTNFQIDSFIANNYKIGITAKGLINFADNTYDIKGMIIPGFIINNLFGIGKIPLIGGVISGILTGGEGGGLFGIKYEYKKSDPKSEATFETNKVSAFVPVSIRNLFDEI